jgi:hypothetical protein
MKRIELSQRVVIEESETTRPSRLREFLVNFFLSIVVVSRGRKVDALTRFVE